MSIVFTCYDKKKPGTRYEPKRQAFTAYYLDIRVGGKRYRQNFPSKKEAEQFVDALKNKYLYSRAGLKQSIRSRITIKQLFEARLASLIERKQKELERRVLTYFQDLVGEFREVESLTLSDLRAFVDKRSKEQTVREEPVKPQTVDRELTIIAAALHNAGEYFEELENYIAPRIPRPKFKKGRRERVITQDEREGILSELYSKEPQIARIFEFASLTGLRRSEIIRLRKTDLDRKARSLRVYRSKTDTISEISPLSDRMLELLNSEYPGEFVFTPDGKEPSKLYEIIKKACETCGIPYGRFKPGGIILHDNRHTWISRLAQAGIDLATIADFSGHSTKEMVLHYSHAGPESRKRAMDVFASPDNRKQLQDIYEDVKEGKITLEEFVRLVRLV